MRANSAWPALVAGWLVLTPASSQLPGADDTGFRQTIAEFALPNGLRVVVAERRQTPVVAVHLVVGSGQADEPAGAAGISGLLERMFSQGGESTGTLEEATEKKHLAELALAMEAWEKERGRGDQADWAVLPTLELRVRRASQSVQQAGLYRALFQLLRHNGAGELLTRGGADAVEFGAVLPSNRVELWFRLVGDWLGRPSARGFFLERNEYWEAGAAAAAQPDRPAWEALAGAAFEGHPYRKVLWPGDSVRHLRPADYQAFAAAALRPRNIAVALAGDVTVAEARRMSEAHLGALTGEPPAAVQAGRPKYAKPVLEVAGPLPRWLAAWPRPPRDHPDAPVFDLLGSLLAGRPRALLNSVLIEQEGVAASADCLPAYPGDRFWSLFVVAVNPAPGADFPKLEQAFDRLFTRLADEPVSPESLLAARRYLERRLAGEQRDRQALAALLARAALGPGGIEGIFQSRNAWAQAGPADIQRVVKTYFAANQRILVRAGPGFAGKGGAP